MERYLGIDAVLPLGSFMIVADCTLYMSSPTEDSVDMADVLAWGLMCWMRKHVSLVISESCV